MILFRLALRQLAAGHRMLVLCLLAATPPAFAALARMASQQDSFLREGFPGIVIGVIVPIIALLAAGSIFATDIEDGTVGFVLIKPVSRQRIVLERFAATALTSISLTVSAAVLAALVAGSGAADFHTFILAIGVAVVVGSMAYTALFLTLSLVTRRGIIVGLLYVLLWESTLAGQFAGTRTLSIKEYMLSIAGAIDRSGLVEHTSTVSPTFAVTAVAIVTSGALILAIMRLRNHEVVGQN